MLVNKVELLDTVRFRLHQWLLAQGSALQDGAGLWVFQTAIYGNVLGVIRRSQ